MIYETDFNIWGSLKKPFFEKNFFFYFGGGGVHEKPIQRGDCLKRGLGKFADLTGGGGLASEFAFYWEGGWVVVCLC